jgi:DNA processing protein
MPLNDEQREWLALSMIPGVGTAMFIRLLAKFRSPRRVLSASRGQLEEVVGPKLAQRINQYREMVDVTAQEKAIDAAGAQLITMDDKAYPLRLAEIYDPPLTLFVRGELGDPEEPSVALVGTRRATPYGIRMAEKLARELAARGVTVVSGMAAGIDAAAHRGALEAGGRTIAVLGNGVDEVYPKQNAGLMDEIIKQGCVLSQFQMGVGPSKGHFPYRNRIISGMSLGVVIVEAPLKSGALITARQAGEQGREVFAVPGQVGVHNSQGPHALLREGAKLVESAEDILVELEASALRPAARAETPIEEPATVPHQQEFDEPPVERPAPEPEQVLRTAARVAPEDRKILKALSPNGSFVDEIANTCRLSVSEALSALTILELKGLVRQFSGKRFAPR